MARQPGTEGPMFTDDFQERIENDAQPGYGEIDRSREHAVQLANGRTIRTDSYLDNPEGSSYVRIVESNGREIAYWTYEEWESDPQLVMGAILGACESTEKGTA